MHTDESGRSRRRWRGLALGVAVVSALVGAGVVGYVHALRTLALPWRTVATGAPVRALAFSPSGEVVAVMGQDAVVRVFRASDGQPVTSFVCAREKGVSLAFLPDGEKLVCSAESSVKLWAWREGRCLKTFPEHPSEVGVLAVSRDGQWIAATASDARVRVWTVEGYLMFRSEPNEVLLSANSVTSYSTEPSLLCLAISRDGEKILVGHSLGLGLLQARAPQRIEQLDDALRSPRGVRALAGVVALATSPTSERFVVSGLGSAYVQSDAKGKVSQLEDASEVGLCSVAYTADGEAIVGADPFGRVRVWESATGKLVAQSRPRTPVVPDELETRVLWPMVVAVSPRGDRVASGDVEGSVAVWWMPGR